MFDWLKRLIRKEPSPVCLGQIKVQTVDPGYKLEFLPHLRRKTKAGFTDVRSMSFTGELFIGKRKSADFTVVAHLSKSSPSISFPSLAPSSTTVAMDRTS